MAKAKGQKISGLKRKRKRSGGKLSDQSPGIANLASGGEWPPANV
jgi:hypothetical protein